MTAWKRLIRLGFRLLYRELAFTYDGVSRLVSGGEWQAWIQTALIASKPVQGETILEIAHGTGQLQLSLAQAGITAWGVDYSAQMGQITAEKLRHQRFFPCLVRAKGQALPFPNQSFDVLLCTFPSDFLLESATLTEFLRVLKPTGRGAIVLHGGLSRGGWWLQLMDKLFYITGQGRILGDKLPSDDELATRYAPILTKIWQAGLAVSPQTIETPRGYAVVLLFSHPKIGDAVATTT